MKQLKKNLAMYICMFMAVFCAMTLQADAANTTSGTLGTNGGISWTYDADTKTLTITGEDSGLAGKRGKSLFVDICADVEVIKVQNCTMKGSAEDMFAYLESLKSVEFTNVNTSQVTDMNCMFYNCSNLNSLDVSNFDTSKVTSMSGMFNNCSSLNSLDVSNFDTSKVTSMYCMFNNCSSLNSLDVSNFDTSKVTSMYCMFQCCESLSSLDLSNFDTSAVTNMGWMFSNCSSLSSLDLSNFDTSKVTSMYCMFQCCESLSSLDLSNFDTSAVTDMSGMFSGCSSLSSLDLSNFDTSKVTDMDYMFQCCESLSSLDLSNFDTSKVTDMSYMFSICSSLSSLDVSNFDTSEVTNMLCMFDNCSSLSSLDVSNFDTSKVTCMGRMFSDCRSLSSLDLSNFDTSKVTTMFNMFSGCTNLSTLNISNFDTSAVTDMSCMFSGCSSLSSLDLSVFDLSMIDRGYRFYRVTEMLLGCTNLAFINIPKAMPAEMTITLPDTFVDVEGNEYTGIGSVVCGKTLYAKKVSPIITFVSRMYTVALGRAAEADGLVFYTERLCSGDSNGACLAQSFLCSPEFINKGYDDAQYVKVLYKTFFDREPAAEEVNYWVGQLNGGKSRAFVLAGFVNSVEFDNLCASYGISRGFMLEDGKPINPGIGRFAERLYTVVLERAGEKEGIEYWSLNIANGVCTPKDAAKNFFLSPEYVNKNTSDAKYITTLYKTFMDREPEAGGVEYWQNVLNNGATREQILEGFADSAEFKGIMANLGL